MFNSICRDISRASQLRTVSRMWRIRKSPRNPAPSRARPSRRARSATHAMPGSPREPRTEPAAEHRGLPVQRRIGAREIGLQPRAQLIPQVARIVVECGAVADIALDLVALLDERGVVLQHRSVMRTTTVRSKRCCSSCSGSAATPSSTRLTALASIRAPFSPNHCVGMIFSTFGVLRLPAIRAMKPAITLLAVLLLVEHVHPPVRSHRRAAHGRRPSFVSVSRIAPADCDRSSPVDHRAGKNASCTNVWIRASSVMSSAETHQLRHVAA